MVWPEPGSPEVSLPRAGVGAPPPRSRKKSRKSTALFGVSSRFASQDQDGILLGSRFISLQALETIGLLAVLVAIGGFIGYWLWPPSAEYLFRQADGLMASTHRSDWLTAQEEYLDSLDKKHPGHPYSEQVQKWRDKILLDEAEGRARNLSSPVKTAFSEPHTEGERQYVSFDVLASKAVADGNEAQAAGYWREMARLLMPDEPDQRKWHLLAIQRAAELESRIQDRRAFVMDQLAKASAALQAGRPTESVTIMAMLREKYGHFVDLADLLGSPPEAPQPSAAPPGASSIPAHSGDRPTPPSQSAHPTAPEQAP